MKAMSQIQLPWSEYRRRRRWMVITMLTYLPGAALIGYALSLLVGPDTAFPLVAGLWMLALLITIRRMASFPCPSCQRPFFSRSMIGNPLTPECMHCGFPKWEEVTPETAEVS